MERSVTLDGPEPASSPETLALRQLLAERERLVEEQAAAIRDLRGRLDAADARLDRLLLTDQRSSEALSWWERWLRWRKG